MGRGLRGRCEDVTNVWMQANKRSVSRGEEKVWRDLTSCVVIVRSSALLLLAHQGPEAGSEAATGAAYCSLAPEPMKSAKP
jgi:hypothetical protein